MRRFLFLLALLFAGPAFGQIGPPPTSWNGIRNPTASVPFTMQNFTTTWTFGSATGANNLFSITDNPANIAATGAFLKIAPGARVNATDLNPIPLVLKGGHTFQGTIPTLQLENGNGLRWMFRTHDVLGGFAATQTTQNAPYYILTGETINYANQRLYMGTVGDERVDIGCRQDSTGPVSIGCVVASNNLSNGFGQSNTAINANFRTFVVMHSRTSTTVGTEMASVSMNGFATNFGGYSVFWTNAAATGTLLNGLAKLTGAPSTLVRTAITDTAGAVGICIMNCGTTGDAEILVAGTGYCLFEGPTTAGNYVQIGSVTAGNCKDAGATVPASGIILGRVLSTNAAAGAYRIWLHIDVR